MNAEARWGLDNKSPGGTQLDFEREFGKPDDIEKENRNLVYNCADGVAVLHGTWHHFGEPFPGRVPEFRVIFVYKRLEVINDQKVRKKTD